MSAYRKAAVVERDPPAPAPSAPVWDAGRVIQASRALLNPRLPFAALGGQAMGRWPVSVEECDTGGTWPRKLHLRCHDGTRGGQMRYAHVLLEIEEHEWQPSGPMSDQSALRRKLEDAAHVLRRNVANQVACAKNATYADKLNDRLRAAKRVVAEVEEALVRHDRKCEKEVR